MNYHQISMMQASPCTRKKEKNQTAQITEAGVTSIEAMLMRTQLRWAGHVSRMEDHRLPKIVPYGELATGCCKRGAPKKTYKDSLKQHLSLGHIDCHLLYPPIGIHGGPPVITLLLPLRTHSESVLRRKDNAERTILANIA
ncbi:hypothetical protein WISP_68248 [Willisornis vidua]|uniref:Uncharacterized protein n=1 Tax=Willisornis vidua TaxID=1566151 RepID=A0ABQ9D8B3_9PASS|nr:hypothetical protein WISP_68248 [Willisornis vidua]